MLAEALQAEVDAYIAAFASERDENGRRLVVRNGSHEPREVLTSAGAVEVTAPRVNDKRTDPVTGERKRFSSAILPPWARKTPKITEVLPLLYLHGLSTGDFVPALGQFLGSSAGLSAAVITRLTEQWQAEQRAFAARDLSGAGLRLPVGRRDPRQHPPRRAQAVPAGHDRRARRWPQGARRPHRRLPRVHRVLGRPVARLPTARHARPGPRGRGRRARVLGRATRGVPADTRAALLVSQDRQRARCAAQELAHPGAKKTLAEIWNAEDKNHARAAAKAFEAAYARSSPRQSRRSPMTSRSCSPSTTTPPSTGFTCAPRTPSSPPSGPYGTVRRSPAAPARRRPDWRWPTSSSRPPKPAGAP